MLVKGAVAIITGGSRGLGKGFSEALLSRGCKVRQIFIMGSEGLLRLT